MKKKRLEFTGFRSKSGAPYRGSTPAVDGKPPDKEHRIPTYRVTRRRSGSRKKQVAA